MKDEGTLREEAAKGERVMRFLETEGFLGTLDQIKAEFMAAWQATGNKQTEERERLWWAVKIADKFGMALTETVNDGKIARKTLEEIKTGRKPFF